MGRPFFVLEKGLIVTSYIYIHLQLIMNIKRYNNLWMILCNNNSYCQENYPWPKKTI